MVGQHCRSQLRRVRGGLPHARASAGRRSGSASGPRDALDFFGSRLAGYRQDQPAFALSYANRRRLEMARAMATEPTLLLLDEPTAGMNPRETLELRDHIMRMRDELGVTILVIEHDMRVVKGVSRPGDRVRLRPEDRRGLVRGGREQRTRDRGLPGHEGDRMSRGRAADGPSRSWSSATSAPTTGSWRCSATSTSRSIAGEMVCLLGGNASGKTTTLKTILGYVTPSEGEVLLDGERRERPVHDRGRRRGASRWCRRTGGCSAT